MPRLVNVNHPLLTKPIIKALKEIKIETVEELLFYEPNFITLKTNLTNFTLNTIRECLRSIYAPIPIPLGQLKIKEEENGFILTTGIVAFDNLINGSLTSGQLTEITGGESTGKTQICMYTALSTAASSTTSSVIYIDTTSSFSAERLNRIWWSSFGSSNKRKEIRIEGDQEVEVEVEVEVEALESVLSRIFVCKAFNYWSLISLLSDLSDQLEQSSTPFFSSVKLIVIDSITSILSPLLGTTIATPFMSQLARTLKSLALRQNLSILYTNNTTSFKNPDGIKPALGESWSYVPSTRLLLSFSEEDKQARLLLLQKQQQQQKQQQTDQSSHHDQLIIPPLKRYFTVIKSSRMPLTLRFPFIITSEGVLSVALHPTSK